jgi:peptide deformylase
MTLPRTAPAALRHPPTISAARFRDDLLADGDYLTRVMRRLRIVQRGDGILTDRDHRGFDLPRERASAAGLLRCLVAMADSVESRYPFKHGMGLAAPQIGVPRRAALVRTQAFGPAITLINPLVEEVGPDAPEPIFEGCLSFFGVRGRVFRPQWITVTHQDLDGTRRRSFFEGDVAALVAHEIDHLDGVLYDTRMAPGDHLIPVEVYRAMRRRSYGRRP